MGNVPSAPAGGRQRRRRVPEKDATPPPVADARSRGKCEAVRIPAATKLPWNPAKAAKLYEFVSKDESVLTWPIGKQSPDAFANALLDSKAKFIKSSTLTVYFRISKDHCARRVFSSSSGFTLAKLLHHIHSAGVAGAVLALKQGDPAAVVCQKDVQSFLSKRTVKCMYLTSSQVYINVKEDV